MVSGEESQTRDSEHTNSDMLQIFEASARGRKSPLTLSGMAEQPSSLSEEDVIRRRVEAINSLIALYEAESPKLEKLLEYRHELYLRNSVREADTGKVPKDPRKTRKLAHAEIFPPAPLRSCQYSSDGTHCRCPCLPLTLYCVQHVHYDPYQQLFVKCDVPGCDIATRRNYESKQNLCAQHAALI